AASPCPRRPTCWVFRPAPLNDCGLTPGPGSGVRSRGHESFTARNPRIVGGVRSRISHWGRTRPPAPGWQRARGTVMIERSIFLAAPEIANPGEQIASLARFCNGNAVLRQGVEALLDANDRSGSFMDRPAAGEATATYEPLAEGPGTQVGAYRLLQQ